MSGVNEQTGRAGYLKSSAPVRNEENAVRPIRPDPVRILCKYNEDIREAKKAREEFLATATGKLDLAYQKHYSQMTGEIRDIEKRTALAVEKSEKESAGQKFEKIAKKIKRAAKSETKKICKEAHQKNKAVIRKYNIAASAERNRIRELRKVRNKKFLPALTGWASWKLKNFFGSATAGNDKMDNNNNITDKNTGSLSL
jgi:hypothetical protein